MVRWIILARAARPDTDLARTHSVVDKQSDEPTSKAFRMSIPENPDPFNLFNEWFAEARTCGQIAEPLAMTLATVDEHGMPWPRIVLLKEVSERGFTFFTNLGSKKARQLRENPKAGLCFYWMPLDKQVRILGQAELVADDEADAYFATRARESQVGAWASRQSERLATREDLEQRFEKYTKEFEGRDVPRPELWSGYRVVPEMIEFWLRAPFRLHHRRVYERQADGSWVSHLLNP